MQCDDGNIILFSALYQYTANTTTIIDIQLRRTERKNLQGCDALLKNTSMSLVQFPFSMMSGK